MTQSPKITDIPLSQLRPLHDLEQVSAEDVRRHIAPQYGEFAEQIAAVFNGSAVAHPELNAANLNPQPPAPEPQAAPQAPEPHAGATLSFSGTSEIKDMSPQKENPQSPQSPQPGNKDIDWAAELAKLKAKENVRTQVNEDDYTNLPADAFSAPYKGKQPEGWVVPEMHAVVEVPETTDAAAEAEEDPYGYEQPAEDNSDVRHPVRIWWEPVSAQPGELVFYRVVADDREMIASPEAGETLMITRGTAYRDMDPGAAGLRHYAVWAYKGADLGEAISSQPLFMGETAVVFPPVNVKVTTIKGAIQVSWDLLEGHEAAVVYACKDTERDLLSPRFEQDIESSGRKATIRVQEAGQTMVVSLLGQAQFRDGRLTSANETVVQHSVKLASELEKMSLTRCERENSDGHDNIEIEWNSPKTGEVKIYLTPHAPRPELRTKAIDKSYVENAFADAVTETRGATPPDSVQNTTMPWPSDWYEVYVTPVNFNEADAWVGESRVLQRVLPIGEDEVRLIERVDSQLISFTWPRGATMVECTTNSGTTTVREEEYELQGGIRLKLERHSDVVRLRPFAMFAGKRTEAREQIIEYPGLRTVTYDFHYDFNTRQLGVYLSSLDMGDRRPFSCQVVYNPVRLPLFAEDGVPLKLSGMNTDRYTSQGLHQGTFEQPDFIVDLDQRTWNGGYVRLFAVEDFATGDFSAQSFNPDFGHDFSLGQQGSFDSDSASQFNATDRTVVVESGVAQRLRFDPLPSPQDGAQNFQQGGQY